LFNKNQKRNLPKLKNTDKIQLLGFVNYCAAYGMRKVVISPGSRNAPLIMAFHNQPDIECYLVPDERSAAYFALGIAQYWQEPVGIVCTSGTAALNYTSALAEAYYQKLPLVAITADRPPEWVDQADGQTINQEGIFTNFTVFQSVLPVEIKSDHDRWYFERMIRDGFTQLKIKNQPIHFNVPLREPLYNIVENATYPVIASKINASQLQNYNSPELANELKNFKNILVVIGMRHPNPDFSQIVTELAKQKNVVVFAETLSNIDSENIFQSSDALVSAIAEKNKTLIPDLVISFGDMLLSKQLKEWLRSAKSTIHWVVNASETVPDVFKRIDRHIVAQPSDFISFITNCELENKEYYQSWKAGYKLLDKLQFEFTEQLKWCDFQVIEILRKKIPAKSILQLGNSSVVRYAQFFKWNKEITFYSNRGTSGIDGSSSTAVGMACQSNKVVTLISGDVSFLYDSNALWNTYKSAQLRIIVINNKGGNIFSLIPGPDNTGLLKEYFTAHIPVSIELLCNAYQIEYFNAKNTAELNIGLDNLYQANGCSLLEIETDLDENTFQWKNYFKTIKNNYTV
jgi:2-succinyl-5-enolpyruvyl-6-hydroxy-3-cyclohexene-1-carboxylate synthase